MCVDLQEDNTFVANWLAFFTWICGVLFLFQSRFRFRSIILRECQCPHGHIHFNVPSTCDYYWLSTQTELANRIDRYFIYGNTNKKQISKDSIWCKTVIKLAGGWYTLKLDYVIFVWQVASMHRAKEKKCCFFANECEMWISRLHKNQFSSFVALLAVGCRRVCWMLFEIFSSTNSVVGFKIFRMFSQLSHKTCCVFISWLQ